MVTREQLEGLYLVQRLSTRQIAAALGVSQGTVMAMLIRNGIPRRGYSDNTMPVPRGSKMSEAHRKAISASQMGNKDLKDSKRGYRLLASRALKQECVFCKGKNGKIVHHRDGNRSNNSIRNLEIMCSSCHRLFHRLADSLRSV